MCEQWLDQCRGVETVKKEEFEIKSLKAEVYDLKNTLQTVISNKQEGHFLERALDDFKDDIENKRNSNYDTACRLRLLE